MTDNRPNLASRLAALRPRPLTPGLEQRIVDAVARPAPSRVAIGLFWGSVAGGTIAALFIIAMFIAPPAAPSSPAASKLTTASTAPDPSLALARAEIRWGDDLRMNDNRSLP